MSSLCCPIQLGLASQLGIGTSLVFSAPWTRNLFKTLGYKIEERIGNKGTFPYPKPDLLATLVVVRDINTLPHADKETREEIRDLRQRPIQEKPEVFNHRQLRISYNLEL